MRHLTYDNIKKLIKIYPNLAKYNNFVETGTYLGGTIFPLSKHFKNLYTIDINSNAYNSCKDKAKMSGIKNINFYLGDSSVVLKDIIPILDGSSIYFLDAHVTDNGSGYTGKGMKDVPLYEELNLINTMDKNECVIIIDDMRLFGKPKSKDTGNADWSNIKLQNLLDIFGDRVIKHFNDPDFDPVKKTKKPLENDRYIIILSQSQFQSQSQKEAKIEDN